MKELLDYALNHPALLVLPAIGFALSLLILRIKRRYVQEGILFRRKPTTERDDRTSKGTNATVPTPSETDAMALTRERMEEMFRNLGSRIPAEVQQELFSGVAAIITEIQNLHFSQQPDADDFMTTADAANLLFVSRRHVAKLLEQGKLNLHQKTGNNRYVTKASVLEYQANQHAAEKAYQASTGEED
ncbi:excisionase family DNA binding protein [Paraburkholderia sp. GAS333]|uniref:helix-turn-helix domain-containing protein n=1 Tax=Paraburkholderia sp. GAS333 TaxID=3156279 RepID=UPI003D1CBB35